MSISTTVGQSITQKVSHGALLRIWAERVLWLTWIPLVLFTVFFASTPDIHNGMHPVRHSTTIVQCH